MPRSCGIQSVLVRVRCVVGRGVRANTGQALVESSVTLTVTLALIFTFMTVCLLMYSYALICESAREGSRYACTHGANCVDANGASCTRTASQVQSYAVSSTAMPNLAGGSMTANVTYASANEAAGTLVTVNVKYDFPIMIPLVSKSLSNIPLSTTSQMTILQ